jgi:hypothetical protein
VTPLISGVGAGALLALVNQALLHVASVRLDQVRMAARRWLDVVLASLSDRANESAGDVRSTATLERAMTSLAEAMHRSRGSSDRVERSTASLERAAGQLEQTIQSFSAEMFAIPEALLNLQKSMAAAASAMEELILVGQRAVANLDVSVAAFRTTVDREFADAARVHWQSSQQLAESAQRTSDATELFREASEGTFALKGLLDKYAAMVEDARQGQQTTSRTIEGLSDAGKRLRQSVEGEMGPAQRLLRESADSFAKSATELSQFVETGLGPAIKPLGELHQTVTGLKEALASVERFSKLRGEIDRLSISLAQAADNASSLAALPEQVRRAVETNLNHHRPGGPGRLRTWLAGRPR